MKLQTCGYSNEDKQLAEKIITHIKREVAQNHSYLEKGVFYFKCEPSEEIECLGANYTTLYYNPIGVINLYEKSPSKLENALIHIVLHCMMLHPSFDAKEEKLFDAAADVIVNAMLDSSNHLIKSDCKDFLNKHKVSTVAQLYKAACENMLIEKQLKALAEKNKYDDHCVWKLKPGQNEEESNGEGGNGRRENGEGENDKRESGEGGNRDSAFTTAMAESEWAAMLNAAESSASLKYGDQSGNMFMSLTPPDRFSKFSYDEYIKRFVEEEVFEDDPENIDVMLYTMSMDMYDDTPIVEWNEISERCNPSDLIIAMDMSGSCGGETASNFLRQIYTLFEEMNIRSEVNIHVVFFDTKILSTFVIRNKAEADEFIRNYNSFGFGGTDFRCVFDYADNFEKENGGKKLKGLFFFSDADGCFPDEKKSYPTTFFVPDNEYFSPTNVPEWIELVHYND